MRRPLLLPPPPPPFARLSRVERMPRGPGRAFGLALASILVLTAFVSEPRGHAQAGRASGTPSTASSSRTAPSRARVQWRFPDLELRQVLLTSNDGAYIVGLGASGLVVVQTATGALTSIPREGMPSTPGESDSTATSLLWLEDGRSFAWLERLTPTQFQVSVANVDGERSASTRLPAFEDPSARLTLLFANGAPWVAVRDGIFSRTRLLRVTSGEVAWAEPEGSYDHEPSWPSGAAARADGSRFAVGVEGGGVVILDSRDFSVKARLALGRATAVSIVGFSRDGASLVVDTGTGIQVFDPETGRKRCGTPRGTTIYGVHLDPRGDGLLGSSPTSPHIAVSIARCRVTPLRSDFRSAERGFEVAASHALAVPFEDCEPAAMPFPPPEFALLDDRRFAILRMSCRTPRANGRTARDELWATAPPRRILDIGGPIDRPEITASDDGLAVSRPSGGAQRFAVGEAPTPTIPDSLVRSTDRVYFGPHADFAILVRASSDVRLLRRNGTAWSEVRALADGSIAFCGVEFASDGRQFSILDCSGVGDGTQRLFDATTGGERVFALRESARLAMFDAGRVVLLDAPDTDGRQVLECFDMRTRPTSVWRKQLDATGPASPDGPPAPRRTLLPANGGSRVVFVGTENPYAGGIGSVDAFSMADGSVIGRHETTSLVPVPTLDATSGRVLVGSEVRDFATDRAVSHFDFGADDTFGASNAAFSTGGTRLAARLSDGVGIFDVASGRRVGGVDGLSADVVRFIGNDFVLVRTSDGDVVLRVGADAASTDALVLRWWWGSPRPELFSCVLGGACTGPAAALSVLQGSVDEPDGTHRAIPAEQLVRMLSRPNVVDDFFARRDVRALRAE